MKTILKRLELKFISTTDFTYIGIGILKVCENAKKSQAAPKDRQIQVDHDQEKAQSEKASHYKNQNGKT